MLADDGDGDGGNGSEGVPFSKHWLEPCELGLTPPLQCNPSCMLAEARLHAGSEFDMLASPAAATVAQPSPLGALAGAAGFLLAAVALGRTAGSRARVSTTIV